MTGSRVQPSQWWTPGGTGKETPARRGLSVEVPTAAAAQATAPRTSPRPRTSSFQQELAAAAVLAAGALALPGAVLWAAGNTVIMERAWSTFGPDTHHDLAADQVCNILSPARYDAFRCDLRMQDEAATSMLRFPVSQGGQCPLATRFDCAQQFGLEQWDQDVPLWRPWDLHNGPAGMVFTGGLAAAGGLAVVGTTFAFGRGPNGRVRRYRFVTKAAAAGAGTGLVAMDVIRHQDLLAGLPGWTGPVLAGTALVAAVSSGRLRAGLRRKPVSVPAAAGAESATGRGR